MKHPLLVQAEENERELAWELDGIRKGIQSLSDRVDYVKKHGVNKDVNDFRHMIQDVVRLLGVSRQQVPSRLRKYL